MVFGVLYAIVLASMLDGSIGARNNMQFNFTPKELADMKAAMQMASESYAYLLKNMIVKENELNAGNYSDDLKDAIDRGEFMEQFREKPNAE